MASIQDYMEALRREAGDALFPLALRQGEMIGELLDKKKEQELQHAQDNKTRLGLLASWWGGYIAPEVKNLIIILAEKRELHLIHKLTAKREEQKKVIVTTAISLSEETKEWLRKEIQETHEVGEFQFKEDKKLIGGAVIRIGDRVVDVSLKKTLQNMYSA